jgi:hypothetical protein
MPAPLPRAVRWLLGLSIASLLFTVPHAAEDFLHGEPARLGLGDATMAGLLAVAYAGQGLALVLSARERRAGHWLHLTLSGVWCVGAVVIHVPEVLAPGPYRAGVHSHALLYGLILSTTAAGVAAAIALSAGRGRRPAGGQEKR